MRQLYGKGIEARNAEIVSRIHKGETVLELCCGDGTLGEQIVAAGGMWRGMDASGALVGIAKRRGLDAAQKNVEVEEWGTADVIVLIASLYQFPNPEGLIKRMKTAAKRLVLIAEPVNNLTPLEGGARRVAGMVVDAGFGPRPERFNEERVRGIFGQLGATEIVEVANGRERLGVFAK